MKSQSLRRITVSGLIAGALVSGSCAARSAGADLSWPPVTHVQRPWAWWWWHGSAVDETNIARELREFRDAGLGGVQITAIYGVQGESSRDIPYLSRDWLKMMGFTVAEARRLGLGVDMTLGSGWCFGGPTVSREDANARAVVRTFDVAAGGKLTEKFPRGSTQALIAYSADGKAVELTDRIAPDGGVNWTAPAGSWKVYAISQKPSGQRVKRAAPGGEGWMLNPLYPRAMRDWLTWFNRAFTGYTGPKPHAVFQDSYEYRTDWSPDFFAQFEKLRGYRLQDDLPALFGSGEDDHTARVKYDYRRTVSDIMAEQSEPLWIAWARRNGFATIYQAHGTPGNWLDLYADADVPETEMFHKDRNPLISKFASSAAHVAGRKLVGAETGTWLEEHFTVTLAELKYLADNMFLSGVNHVFYHGTCYSPADARWPGWLFYASTEMNPRNSIWHDVPALNEYIARCQAVLQSGRPDNDILLYWPVADFWSRPQGLLQPMTVGNTRWFEDQAIGRTATELWKRGYAFDYVSDRQLQTAKVTDGKIQMPGGSYRVIVVPECKLMPLETFQKLVALARSGATVIFQKQLPSDVPGLSHLKSARSRFKELSAAVSSGALQSSGGSIKDIGRGRVLLGSLEVQLAAAHSPPEEMAVQGLSFIRRAFDGGWYYFIANRGNQNFDGWITLSRAARSVGLLDPMTGASGVAAVRLTGGRPQVHLQIPAGASVILRALAHREIQGPVWTYWQTNGPATAVTGKWDVRFLQGGPVIPAAYETAKLSSWTDAPDTNAQAFAGTARYEMTFNASAVHGDRAWLDLGKVCQSARVTLNGKDYGTLITPPFRVVVDNLKPAGNKLVVEVTNVSANRIRDLDRRGVKWRIFKDINFVNINYRPFDASHWPLTDSGLLGPATLTPVGPAAAH